VGAHAELTCARRGRRHEADRAETTTMSLPYLSIMPRILPTSSI